MISQGDPEIESCSGQDDVDFVTNYTFKEVAEHSAVVFEVRNAAMLQHIRRLYS